ncbi:MAG: hypothetical protein ACFE9L_03315 [Candidatus Hodarchaeota archaeon]
MDPGYQEQLELQKYVDHRRSQINDWINREDTTLITLSEAIQKLKRIDYYEVSTNIYAILDPLIVGSLDYHPDRNVAHIREVSPERKQWLIDYWKQKYKIDVSESEESPFSSWRYEVGLIFTNWSYYYEAEYESVYDYPSCLTAAFLIKGDDLQ